MPHLTTTDSIQKLNAIEMDLQILRASFVPQSFDDERLSLKAVVATDGFEVQRHSWEIGSYIQKLNLRSGLDVSRALEGAMPLLLDHETNIGIVENLTLEGSNLVADLLFTKEEELSVKTYRRLKEGTIKKFSIGYVPHKMTLLEINKDDDIKKFSAEDIQILEVTVTGMPANPKTYVLSQDRAKDYKYSCKLSLGEFEKMAESQEPRAPEEKKIPLDTVLYLSKMKMEHNLSEEFFQSLLSMEKTSKGDYADLILQHLSQKQPKTPVNHGVTLIKDEKDKIIPLVTDALVHRYCPQIPKLSKLEHDNKFATFSFMDCARYILQREGRETLGLGNNQIYHLIQGREDFATITQNYANRILLEGYTSEVKSYLPFVRIRETPSFGTNLSSRASRAPLPMRIIDGKVPVGELGPDEVETYRAFAYSVLMTLTREALVDDDLGQFSADVWAFGYQTNLLEANLVYSQIINNPEMAGGAKLFSPEHKNVGKGESLDEQGLSTARAAIRGQVDGRGNRLNLIMRNIIVGSDLETPAEKYTYTDIVPANTSDVNPFARSVRRIVDSVMDINPDVWIATVANTQAAIVEVAYLKGQQGPYILSESDIRIDGRMFRYGIDVGVKVVDWRGIWINKIPTNKIPDPVEPQPAPAPERRTRSRRDDE